MARRRYKYKPYKTRKQQTDQRIRRILFALVLIIIIVVVLIKLSPNDSEATGNETVSTDDGIETVTLQDILPSGAGRTAPPADDNEMTEDTSAAEPTAESTWDVTEPEPAATSSETQAAGDESSPEALEVIKQALELKDQGKIIAARDLLDDVLDKPLSAQVRSAVKFQLGKLAEIWLFSQDVLAGDTYTSRYLVPPRDSLELIGKKHKVPYQLLQEINGIHRPTSLQAGAKIKVIDGPFNVVVYKSSFTMDLYLQNMYVKTYRVGLGTMQHETPSGLWRVKPGGKLVKPTWTDPDTGKTYVGDAPDYPLGSRWIAIEGLDENTKNRTGFAIHGTKDPDSIGQRSSRGCIRLFNGDVQEVYNLLYEGVSQVVIKD